MRGRVERQATMVLIATTDQLVPADHPIRRIRDIIDPLLEQMGAQFSALYSEKGRHSVPPEHLVKGTLLMALYSIRSERQFCERLQYDMLFKWFLGLNIQDAAFDHSTFSKNRQRLLDHNMAQALLGAVVDEARRRHLVSDDHFSVDGTLLQAWASIKSVHPRDEDDDVPPPQGRNPDVDFKGQRRTNDTHVSRTDPEARLARKGNGMETRLCFSGHLLMENRSGLIMDVLVTQATGTAEREAALRLVDRRRTPRQRITLGADKGYDTRDFVEQLRQREVTPHVAQNVSARRRSAIDGRTTHHPGYAKSIRVRKRIEECFGWMKTVGGGRKLRYIGVAKNQLWASFNAVAFNLVRMTNIAAQTA